jgi:hypothetical protein
MHGGLSGINETIERWCHCYEQRIELELSPGQQECMEESLALSSPRPKRQQTIERRTLRNETRRVHGGVSGTYYTINERWSHRKQQHYYYRCTEESPASIMRTVSEQCCNCKWPLGGVSGGRMILYYRSEGSPPP